MARFAMSTLAARRRSQSRTAAAERRRYYRITRKGPQVASAEVERLRSLLEKALSTGLAPDRRHV